MVGSGSGSGLLESGAAGGGGGGGGLFVVSVTLKSFFFALTEAPPSDGERGVDADEQEERPADVHVENALGGDVGRHPSFAPMLGDEVEEVVGGGEGVTFRTDRGGSLRGGGDVGGQEFAD